MENKDALEAIDFAIEATSTKNEYSIGLRNGLILAKSYLTGEIPKFDTVKNIRFNEEAKSEYTTRQKEDGTWVEAEPIPYYPSPKEKIIKFLKKIFRIK